MSVTLSVCCRLCPPRSQHQSICRWPSSAEGTAAGPSRSSDVELRVVAELGGAQGEAGVSHRRGHVRVLEGGVVAIARLVVRVDGRGWEEPVRGWSRVVLGADAQGDLVHYSASLGMGEAVAVLEDSWGRRAGGQDGVWVVSGECGGGGVLQQGVLRGRGVRGTAVRQVGEGVRVARGGDVSVRTQRPIVAVPLFGAVVGTVQLHLSERESETKGKRKNDKSRERAP